VATNKNSAGTFRRHVSRDGRVSFTATIRVSKFAPTSKTFATRAEARKWAAETKTLLIKQREKKGAPHRDLANLSVADVLLEWLRDPETQRLRSFDGVHQMAAWWIAELGATKVLDVNVLALRTARDKLSKGRAPGTVNRYLIVIRAAWNWAIDAELIPSDRQWPKRLMLSQPEGRKRFLSDAELASLLKAAGEHSQLMHTAIMLAVATGMRRGELLRLNWSDIDLAQQVAAIRITKTDQPRRVHLTSSACEALRALQGRKIRAIDGAVFTDSDGTRLLESTFEGRWRKIRDRLGLKDFRFHDLRHSCASFLAQAGASLLAIAEVLGHRALTTTQRYAHLIQGAPLPAHAALDAKLSKRTWS
jgi:integrase